MHFLYKFFVAKTSNQKHSFASFGAKIMYKKRRCKTLMKLSQGHNRLLLNEMMSNVFFLQNNREDMGVKSLYVSSLCLSHR